MKLQKHPFNQIFAVRKKIGFKWIKEFVNEKKTSRILETPYIVLSM